MINIVDNNKNSVIMEDSKEYEESKSFHQQISLAINSASRRRQIGSLRQKN
jgi:hypothetical protein